MPFRKSLVSQILILFFLFFTPHLLSAFTKPSNGAKAQLLIPDPMKLSPSWWDYLNVDDESLPKHIQKTEEALDTLRKSLSEEEQSHEISLLKRINVSLQSLPETRTPLPPVIFVKKEFFSQYDLPDLIQLGKSLREHEVAFHSQTNKLLTSDNNVKSETAYYNTLLAHYLTTSEKSKDRLTLGIEVILTKLELVHHQHRHQLLALQLEKQKSQISLIREEITYARTHFQPSKDRLPQLEEEISGAEKQLLLSQTEAFRALTNLNRKLDPQLFSQQERESAAQSVLRANIKAALANLTLINKKIQKEILLPATESENKKASLLEQLSLWSDELAKIQKESLDWKRQTNEEMESTLKKLSQETIEPQEMLSERKALLLVNETFLNLNKLDNELFLNDFLLQQLDLLFNERYATIWERFQITLSQSFSYLKKHTAWFDESLFKIGDTPITPLAIFKALFIALIAYFLAKGVQTLIKKLGERYSALEESAIYTLSRVVYYCIFYIGLFIAITSFGIELTAIAFIAGAVTFWIGFGLVPVVTNFASGIIVLIDKNIRKGDLVQLESGETGTIAEMNVRTSVLHTEDGKQMIIPNTELVIKKITNRSRLIGVHILTIPFQVAPLADKDKIQEIVIKAAKELATTSVHKEPQLYLKEFDNHSLSFELRVWIARKEAKKESQALYSSYLWALESALRKHEIPL
ncbi:MAG: hypothetical protein A3G30_05285 [Chlamydiae bacterium RIFCSPLOWO2_12_FULL_49_12]|nr:MAG: hypothetical protein A3I15_00635 [Chlamydiae bacterium RIFCSPLOWO2_02_FULL_49_12]OGN75219.1 MAG: hypothetical protein A3G30_05285 [Chlamydiae bacterium RIFCSPLOWO2_12_FULL_49_12]